MCPRKRDIAPEKSSIYPRHQKLWDIIAHKIYICPKKQKPWDIIPQKTCICPNPTAPLDSCKNMRYKTEEGVHPSK